MAQDDETLVPEHQATPEDQAAQEPAAEEPADQLAGPPVEAESNPEAEAESRLLEQESVASEDEVPLDESPMAETEEIAAPDKGDLTTADDQELEVSARLGEEATSADEPAVEPVPDLSSSDLEQETIEAEVTRQRPARERVEDRPSRLGDEGTPDFSQMPQPDPQSDGRAWYVVHCYSGYENKVRHNLEQRIESMGMKDKIFDVVVPTEEEIEVKEGKRRTVERRVFPGYILVNMIMSEESWYVVRNTPGVTSFVGQGNTPLPLRPEEVTQIVKRMEADAPRIKVTFRQGERVRIVDGPFNDFRGTVSEIDMERAKVRVMVNFFGRETPVELDFLQVEKA
jgi:transcriptional antiterminator NusG